MIDRSYRSRCAWAKGPLLLPYHDEEWGVPEHTTHRLFELLTLEGAQAGLSWSTVLARRDGYRRVFRGFDPEVVAAFSAAEIERCLVDPRIIRHRQKVAATVSNARALLALRADDGGFARYLWRFVEGRPLQPRRPATAPAAATTPLSWRMSRELRRRGFRFVGPTICHALMQAAGLVNDHEVGCFRHAALCPDGD